MESIWDFLEEQEQEAHFLTKRAYEYQYQQAELGNRVCFYEAVTHVINEAQKEDAEYFRDHLRKAAKQHQIESKNNGCEITFQEALVDVVKAGTAPTDLSSFSAIEMVFELKRRLEN